MFADFDIWGFSIIICVIIGLALLFLIRLIVRTINKSPFKYPYYEISFDVTGKHNPKIEDYIDNYIINNGVDVFYRHKEKVDNWKRNSQDFIDKSIFKRIRNKQYLKSIDDENMFKFKLDRCQTRYQQIKYEKTPYQILVSQSIATSNLETIVKRYKYLKLINFECTINEYNVKSQRKLMTKELRERIALRDNFTCQICGKYMPDSVGLQIDHIVPISRGGKSVPSNLQVLCSKCNGKKSAKFD